VNRFCAAPVVFLVAAAVAPAQVVTIVRVANTSTVVPGGTATFSSFGPYPSVDGSSVAFYGQNSASPPAIYGNTSGIISTLVPAGAPIPNGTGNFSGAYGLGYYQNGIVAFVGGNATQGGVYTANGTTISRFADLNTPIPGGTGDFTAFYPEPSISGGTVAFVGSGASPGIYSSTGGTPPTVTLVADNNTAVPGGTSGNFTGIAYPAVSGSTAAFGATFSIGGVSQGGVYQRVGTGPITTIADSNTLTPDGTGNFSRTFGPPSISGSNVAFIDENHGLYARINGVLTTIADTSTPSPNGTGNFTGFFGDAYAPISGNEVAFIGYTPNSTGIYVYDGSALHALIDNTNPIFDGQPLASTTPFFLGPDAIDGNQIAFGVNFFPPLDPPAATGIYLATFTPVPEPSTLVLVGIGALALIRRRRRHLRISATSE
jgi:hypothetical protein